jgi:membrane protein YqaA with SNARE-associated domain
MSKSHSPAVFAAFALVFSIVLWSWLLLTYGADAIVDWIGAENGYWIMFLVALFGGVSSIAGVTYVATIITLASAGLNPLALAIASGAGISIGDTIYYYIGRYGLRTLTHGVIHDRVQQLTEWLRNKSKKLLFLVIYVYTAFTPLPNDVLTITLGLTQQPWRVVIVGLVLGNITLTFIIAQFGQYLPL